MDKKIPKEAICIRNASSWGYVKPEHKFDSKKFSTNTVVGDLPDMSPKMDALIKKIAELDQQDMASEGKYYKHIIYSDVAGIYGAKMVASVLIANDFHLVYNNGLKMKDSGIPKNKGFGLLTTSTVYQKPLPVKLKKTMLGTMNARPNNIYGTDIRFLVIDPGFKEGIDVYDVKYLHMLEPLVTKAEQTQVVGRGTRFCGQVGLPFIPNKGWQLNVFRYNMMYDSQMNVHELYLKHSNQNVSALNFIADLEDLVITSAVDLPLTEKIHNLDKKNNRFYKMIKGIRSSLGKSHSKSSAKKPSLGKQQPKDFIKIVNNVQGKVYTNMKRLDCKKKCEGPLALAPTAILMIAAVYVGKKELLTPLRDVLDKQSLCKYIDKMPDYCNVINQIWLSPIRFFKIFKKTVESELEKLRRSFAIHPDNLTEIKRFIHKYTENDDLAMVPLEIYSAVPPSHQMNYLDLQKYIEKHYKAYKWDELEIKNKCTPTTKPPEQEENEAPKKNYEIVNFTKAQGFVQNYLTPASPYKGLFLYHSVGSGKTCSAIATATNTFDREGYTILWVTRHTLKEDIWKNMFDKICNVIIQEKIKNGEKMPNTRAQRMKMLGKNWMQPISYKQFTNLIQGKNQLYKQLVAINGRQDPFKKTLVIIDEIHKIYSSTLSGLEKPNPAVLQKMIQTSFEQSGKNSVKMLIMTATPITEDPMSCIKIINLLLPKAHQFPEDFEVFKAKYCQDDGLFTDAGAMKFLNEVAGLVSFIDRSSDVSQFAYPVIEDVMITPSFTKKSVTSIDALEAEIKEIEEQLKNKSLSKDAIKKLKAEMKVLKKQLKDKQKKWKQSANAIDYIKSCLLKKTKTSKNNSAASNGSPKSPGNNKKQKKSYKSNKRFYLDAVTAKNVKNIEDFFEEFGDDNLLKDNIINAKKFKLLLLKYHPDKHPMSPDDYTEISKRLNEARVSFSALMNTHEDILKDTLKKYNKIIGGRRTKSRKVHINMF